MIIRCHHKTGNTYKVNTEVIKWFFKSPDEFVEYLSGRTEVSESIAEFVDFYYAWKSIEMKVECVSYVFQYLNVG
jgi:hypothetical protein